MSMKIHVMKFGGTSVSSIDRIRNVASIINKEHKKSIKMYPNTFLPSSKCIIAEWTMEIIERTPDLDETERRRVCCMVCSIPKVNNYIFMCSYWFA